GRLAADLSKMQLYDGSGKGTLKLDGSGAVPALDSAFTLDKVQAEPLLKDAMDLDRFSGSANGDMTIQSQGKSQKELIGNLGGKGSIRFAKGAIKGINIGALPGAVKTALPTPASLANMLVDAKSQSNETTQFAELTGTYTITKGVLDNKDMKLDGPLVHAT